MPVPFTLYVSVSVIAVDLIGFKVEAGGVMGKRGRPITTRVNRRRLKKIRSQMAKQT